MLLIPKRNKHRQCIIRYLKKPLSHETKQS
ncbi:MAG: hypothetical protein J5666_07075 [Bacilli bacterium]|nr:hypothetical protein [Bacilli bacterium]